MSAFPAVPVQVTEYRRSSRPSRRLTNFGRDFIIKDFDVSRDGGEIVFDRVQQNSNIVMIDRRSSMTTNAEA